jgi:ribonuclease Y
MLLAQVENEIRDDANKLLREIEQEVKEEADQRSRKILATTMQRLTSDVVSENTVSVVPLPSEDMKGRIIGREGRNIRALEQALGVDVVIDDTPDAVTLSSFDPIRREIGRIALTRLLSDGRIHPARIEEMAEKAKKDVDIAIKEAGEEAIVEASCPGLHPEIVRTLGRLKFRYSYGQNQLKHAIETANLGP